MMRAVLLLAFALPAAAQAPAEPVKAPERPAQRPPLNLQLDNPSSFATTSPPEKEPAKGLPTLGDDARRIEPPKRSGSRPAEGGPFPKDTNPNL